ALVTGAIVSVFAGGCFFGALIAGYTANKIGRKRTIQLGALIAVVGCTIQTAAVNVGMLIAGRFIAGLSIGVLSMIVPLYQAEISPPHARGLLSGWTQMMITAGFFVANWVGYGCQFLQNDGQWRVPLAIQIVPAVILGAGMFVLPYSPRWLAQEGRHEEAMASLIRLHGSEANRELIAFEYDEIVTQIAWEKENVSNNFMDLFNTRPSLTRTMCGIMVQVCCQWTGVNVNSYFGPTIYANLGYTGSTILLISGISGAWGMIVTFIFITWMVDRIGRRKPLVYGGVAMAVCLAWQAGVASSDDPNYQNSSAGIAGIASIFLFSGVFSISYGPVSWVYQSEVFSMPLRAMGTSISTASNWAMNVLLSQITPIGLKNLSYKYFFIFVASNVANSVVAYFLFKETKGLTLEELGAVFGDFDVIAPPSARRIARDAANASPLDEEKKTDMAHNEFVTERV
ncbi:general substrate transporter, partial [Mrakia frigida]|uniref:general substrate transporter n=1 Tax=Mrakia frigida TaxID=29902 RepID=UPI003FCC113D